MSLLYDRIASEGVRAHGKVLRGPNTLPSGPVFLIQNVADYFHTHIWTADHGWYWGTFPNLAPPFDTFWMEFAMRAEYYPGAPLDPKTRVGVGAWAIDCEGRVDPGDAVEVSQGIEFFEALSVGENVGPVTLSFSKGQGRQQREADVFGFLMGTPDKRAIIKDAMARVALACHVGPRLGIRWLVMAHMFCDHMGAHPFHVGGTEILIRSDGTVFHHTNNHAFMAVPDDAIGPAYANNLLGGIMPAFLAISFLHCRNVATTECPVSLGLSKAHQKRHGKPLVRYHTLNIEPMKQVLKHEGGVEKTGLKRALHICRGHFAHYSEEKPLFGRIAGTVWRPSHVRGSLDEGIVDKDYRIKEPAA